MTPKGKLGALVMQIGNESSKKNFFSEFNILSAFFRKSNLKLPS